MKTAAAAGASEAQRAGVGKIALASLVGTTIEFYDFYIFGTAAALVFGPMFFPRSAPETQTLNAYLTFGLAFLAIEIREFASLVARGAGPTRSAFLSSFFSLVGCHGLHVSAGILWLLTMMAQVFAKGFRADIQRRILCFALFWHALDIIWIGVFTVVYLLGSAP